MSSLVNEYAKCNLQCLEDKDCPLLHYCSPNGCGRLCVPPHADVVEDCGCSVTFLKQDTYNEDYVLNLIWESLKDNFTPSMEPYIVEGFYEYTLLGPMDNQCSLKRTIEEGPRCTEYSAFRRPRRMLIIVSDEAQFLTDVAAAPFDVLYSPVCVISKGNISIDENLLKQISVMDNNQLCLFSVDSFANLGDVAHNISSIFNNGTCLCGNETVPTSPCRDAGETCTKDGECDQPTHICMKGVCSPVTCSQPEMFDPDPIGSYSYFPYFYDYYDNYYFTDIYFGFYEDYDYYFGNAFFGTRRTPSSRRRQARGVKELKNRKKDLRISKEMRKGRKDSKGGYPKPTKNRCTLAKILESCCARDEFQCSGVPTSCIRDIFVCDTIKDCHDGSDETPEACAKRTCGDGWFKCNSGHCIEPSYRCDGIQHCPDDSDENCFTQADCPSNRPHNCSSGECISFEQVCNNVLDCKSGEDEIHCKCRGHRCLSSPKCVRRARICDGYNNCLDGSDEHCGGSIGTCPNDRPFKCDNGTCLEKDSVCDSYNDCNDGSDKDLALCSPESCFYCKSGQCIHNRTVCDGFDDCDDRSDEMNCKSFVCGKNEFKCNSGECLPDFVKCNYREECADGSDEFACDSCPDSSPLSCSSGECIDYSMICKGIYDCADKSDESKCLNMTCPNDRPKKCASGQCICRSNDRRCYHEDTCIDGTYQQNVHDTECSGLPRCDGQRDCEDGSDEDDCEGIPCPSENSWRCKSGECIWTDNMCDGLADCQDGSDEENCLDYKCPPKTFKCASGECIDGTACNSYIDCTDASDEKDCVNPPKCFSETKRCQSGECLDKENFCDGELQCYDGSDEDRCQDYNCPSDRSFHCKSGECIRASEHCDGFISCADGSDEEDCQTYSCPFYRPYSCPSGVCITIYQLCNSVDDCGDGSDEMDCQNVTCPEKSFKCNKGNCIPPRYRCNGKDDCDEGEDELNCKNYAIQCPYRFPCIADNKCIYLKDRCDGRKDCSDWADEKGCSSKP